MTTFDESKVRRATDGKFANKPHAESDVSLHSGSLSEEQVFELLNDHGLAMWEDPYIDDDGTLVIDSPSGHADVSVNVKRVDNIYDLRAALAEEMESFDVDEQFYRHLEDLGRGQGQPPTALLASLESDRRFLADTAESLRRENRGLPPVGWLDLSGVPSPDLPVTLKNAEDFMHEAGLMFGDAAVRGYGKKVSVGIVGPSGTLVQFDVDKGQNMSALYEDAEYFARNFNAREEFEDYSLSQLDEVKQLIAGLEEDEKFFHNLAENLRRIS